MTEHSPTHKTVLEVAVPGRPQQSIPITHSPFLIGRAGESGNHLSFENRHVSHRCAAIVAGRGGYLLEDRGNRAGVFVNGQKVTKKTLHDGDTITFGPGDDSRIVFHSTAGA